MIVGDSNMSEYTTFVKVGAAACMLRMLEDNNVVLRDMTLENPIRAIREISHDMTCRRTVRLANGREVSALDIQREYLDRALRYADSQGFPPLEQRALEMWEHCITTIEKDPLLLDREVDWVIKYKLIEAFRARHDLPLGHARVQLLDLQYHDVSRPAVRSTSCRIAGWSNGSAPTPTSRPRSMFLPRPPGPVSAVSSSSAAKERKRDYTVDWVHLKLNDQAQRTVLCKDPFKSRDERVERLIESL